MTTTRTKASISLAKTKRPWRRTQQFFWRAEALNGQSIAGPQDLYVDPVHALVMAVQVTDGSQNSCYQYRFFGWTNEQIAAAEHRLGRAI